MLASSTDQMLRGNFDLSSNEGGLVSDTEQMREGDEDPKRRRASGRKFRRWILLAVSADLPHLGTDGCMFPS